ncbi:hypothetical protein BDF14DRAFT_1884204 [Spinellus fusiger]|nr:hypothetical protein BDF14DRAFT_1884204 [Spinellus fusiger]
MAPGEQGLHFTPGVPSRKCYNCGDTGYPIRNFTKPCGVANAKKKNPMMINEQGQVETFDILEAVKTTFIHIPLHQLLYHSPDLKQILKEGLGFTVGYKAKVNQVATIQSGICIDLSKEESSVGAMQVIQLLLKDEIVEAMIDSGAAVSLIPLTLVKHIDWENCIEPTEIKLNFGQLSVKHNFLVSDHPETPFLLGRDFLKGVKIILDIHNEELIFDVDSIPGQSDENKQAIINTHEGTGRKGYVSLCESHRQEFLSCPFGPGLHPYTIFGNFTNQPLNVMAGTALGNLIPAMGTIEEYRQGPLATQNVKDIQEQLLNTAEPQDTTTDLEGFDEDYRYLFSRAPADPVPECPHQITTLIAPITFRAELPRHTTQELVQLPSIQEQLAFPRSPAVPHDAKNWLQSAIKQLMKLDKIEVSNSEWAAGTVLIPADMKKRKKQKRMRVIGKAPSVKITPIPRRIPGKIYEMFPEPKNEADQESVEEEWELEEDNMKAYVQRQFTADPPQRLVKTKEGEIVRYTTVAPQQTPKDPYWLCLDYKPVNA